MAFLGSLRSRLLISYLLVVVVSLLAAGLALTYLLQGYRDRLAVARLADVAVPVNVQVRALLRQGESPDGIVAYLRDQAEETEVRVLLLNRQGVVLQDTAVNGSLRGQALAVPATADPRVAQGYRYSTDSGPALIYVVVPLNAPFPRPDGSNVAFLGVAQAESLGSTFAELLPRLLIAAAVAFVAAIIIALAVANSLYRPIKRLTHASESMSRGDYAQRVPIAGPQELAELATSFNRMAEEVQRSRQVLRDFVADVSHELKTPLTSIRGFVQAMSDGTAGDPEERKQALAVVDGEARRLQGLVAQLLDLSRMEAGQVAMEHRPLPLAEVVQYCLEIFAPRAAEKGVKLVADVDGEFAVVGDADRLEQLLSNLLDNAVRHTPSGGSVTVSARAAPAGTVQVAVADSGSGIPPDELPRIFERFHTAGGSVGGTGLGLAIARGIAHAHGGDISAASTPGQGSTFTVTLPLARDQAKAGANNGNGVQTAVG